MTFTEIFNECNEIKLTNQKIGKKLNVNIIMKLKTKYGDNLLLYDKIHNVKFFGNSLLKSYLSKCLESLQNKDDFYFKDDLLSAIMTFKIIGVKEINGNNQILLEFIKKQNNNDEVLDLSDESDNESNASTIKSLEEKPEVKPIKQVKTVRSDIDKITKVMIRKK